MRRLLILLILLTPLGCGPATPPRTQPQTGEPAPKSKLESGSALFSLISRLQSSEPVVAPLPVLLPVSLVEPPRPVLKPELVKVAPIEVVTKPSFEKDVLPVVEKFCIGCHSGPKPRASFSLDGYKTHADAMKNPKAWEKVAENLRSRAMPPDGKPKPTEIQLDRLNTWLDVEVFKVDCSIKRDPGRVTMRRLNRAEYNNTIRDLVGVDFQPAADFPTDDAGYGFDNNGDVLSLPLLLTEKYLDAAEKIADVAWKDAKVREKLLNPPPHPVAKTEQGVKLALRTFAERAYRRPIEEGEMRRLNQFLDLARRANETPEFGVKLGITAVLVSPHFLFRVEVDGDPKQTERRLNEWELASRLSYFLWASLPDDELFGLARQGKLSDPAVLTGQVRRMLRDPKSRALVDNFALQWLTVRSLRSFTPDPKLFPQFNDTLREAMIAEPARFFEHVVREDRSILELLDSRYTFVNEPLAKFYGFPNVTGKEFRKIDLPDDKRGGVLTMASVLTVTSNPTRTSPVKRGKWILENILGTPPPPPPPGVEELSEDQKIVESASLRQRLEQHRSNPNCATCHQRMDPLGFGFENFDAIGGWRTMDGKFAIDTAGVLPSGETFAGPAELRKILLNRKTDFTKCFAEKLMTYALGRGLERTDRCYLDEIAANVAKDDFRITSLVLEIVRSEPFQMRRGKRANP